MTNEQLKAENAALRNLNLKYLKQIEQLKGEVNVSSKKVENMELMLKACADLETKMVNLEKENFHKGARIKELKNDISNLRNMIKVRQLEDMVEEVGAS